MGGRQNTKTCCAAVLWIEFERKMLVRGLVV